jgi:hypothetical protein
MFHWYSLFLRLIVTIGPVSEVPCIVHSLSEAMVASIPAGIAANQIPPSKSVSYYVSLLETVLKFNTNTMFWLVYIPLKISVKVSIPQ